jgi:hypothetical protein
MKYFSKATHEEYNEQVFRAQEEHTEKRDKLRWDEELGKLKKKDDRREMNHIYKENSHKRQQEEEIQQGTRSPGRTRNVATLILQIGKMNTDPSCQRTHVQ